ERELGKIRQSRGVLKDSGRDTAADGDFAEVTIIGFVDGKSEDSLTSPNDMIRIGSKASPEGLEEGLKGMKIGQEKDIKVKFPADFGDAKLAGKQADLKVTLKALKTLDVPELNDDFVKGLGAKFTTVVELKDAIRAELKKQAETAARNHNIDAVFSELLKANVFDVAEGLVIQETDAIMSRYESQLANQGLNIEKLGLNRAEVRKKYAKAAEDNVRLRYILRKVAEAEKIEVTDADVEAEIRKIAESTKEDADAMLKRAKQSWDALKAQYLEDKVIERLLELAK
ncbi:MAG TPA: trigger factor, partial [Candidatus Goldiibacteriota bacterium]|nr:trigger factor [Candidatus Goldiibacteriota bacterium]